MTTNGMMVLARDRSATASTREGFAAGEAQYPTAGEKLQEEVRSMTVDSFDQENRSIEQKCLYVKATVVFFSSVGSPLVWSGFSHGRVMGMLTRSTFTHPTSWIEHECFADHHPCSRVGRRQRDG